MYKYKFYKKKKTKQNYEISKNCLLILIINYFEVFMY